MSQARERLDEELALVRRVSPGRPILQLVQEGPHPPGHSCPTVRKVVRLLALLSLVSLGLVQHSEGPCFADKVVWNCGLHQVAFWQETPEQGDRHCAQARPLCEVHADAYRTPLTCSSAIRADHTPQGGTLTSHRIILARGYVLEWGLLPPVVERVVEDINTSAVLKVHSVLANGWVDFGRNSELPIPDTEKEVKARIVIAKDIEVDTPKPRRITLRVTHRGKLEVRTVFLRVCAS